MEENNFIYKTDDTITPACNFRLEDLSEDWLLTEEMVREAIERLNLEVLKYPELYHSLPVHLVYDNNNDTSHEDMCAEDLLL